MSNKFLSIRIRDTIGAIMRRKYLVISLLFFIALLGGVIFIAKDDDIREQGTVTRISTTSVPSPTPTDVPLPQSYTIGSSQFISQSFNNCGPASLAMVMNMQGSNVTQLELGLEMRPHQNPVGDNDDKSIFADEFVMYAKKYGFESLHRPNGTITLLKKFVTNEIPVVVRTWLNPNEDIGHFRVVRGYDEATQTILQDDSYQGPNLRYDYQTFLKMWQPFNYGYILVYPKEKQAIVERILADEINESTAFTNAVMRAQEELTQEPDAIYPHFNLATAYYYLQDYEKAATHYEAVEARLPSRMLWYQIEPIQIYQKLGNKTRVFTMTDRILTNNNRAFSELYFIRGELLLAENDRDGARREFEKAVLYNKNYTQARNALNTL